MHFSAGASKTQIEGTVSTDAVKIELLGGEASAFTYITFDGTGKYCSIVRITNIPIPFKRKNVPMECHAQTQHPLRPTAKVKSPRRRSRQHLRLM